MTYHIHTDDYYCTKCSVIYVPYEKGMPCPNCGQPEESQGENYYFIDKLAQSMRTHKLQFRRFQPPAWIASSCTEYVQLACFKTFDLIEKYPDKGLDHILGLLQLDGEEINDNMTKHMKKIILEVEPAYRKLPKIGWFERILAKVASKIL